MDMRTVIVIGNGFDIDLGWHTSMNYSKRISHKLK